MSAAVSPPAASRRPSATRVLAALTRAATAKEGSGACCSLSLHHPRVAGIGAHSRVSELRAEGWRITKEPCWCPERCRTVRLNARKRGERLTSHRWAYRLSREQAEEHL